MASEFATVGYYIGGMKQKDLDKSEEKSVILGTYPRVLKVWIFQVWML